VFLPQLSALSSHLSFSLFSLGFSREEEEKNNEEERKEIYKKEKE
jgi:hypothetical protein